MRFAVRLQADVFAGSLLPVACERCSLQVDCKLQPGSSAGNLAATPGHLQKQAAPSEVLDPPDPIAVVLKRQWELLA